MRRVLLVVVLVATGLATGCGGGGEEKKEARGEISFLVFRTPRSSWRTEMSSKPSARSSPRSR